MLEWCFRGKDLNGRLSDYMSNKNDHNKLVSRDIADMSNKNDHNKLVPETSQTCLWMTAHSRGMAIAVLLFHGRPIGPNSPSSSYH
jgi:hypothetical protein